MVSVWQVMSQEELNFSRSVMLVVVLGAGAGVGVPSTGRRMRERVRRRMMEMGCCIYVFLFFFFFCVCFGGRRDGGFVMCVFTGGERRIFSKVGGEKNKYINDG